MNTTSSRATKKRQPSADGPSEPEFFTAERWPPITPATRYVLPAMKFIRASGKKYEIIGSSSIGPRVHETVDLVKSLDTGKWVEMSRIDLIEFMKT